MERFVIIVNGWKLLTIITKHSILDVAAALDPPLSLMKSSGPNKDPCGTPADIFANSLKELFVLKRWRLFVWQFLIKLIALLSKPYAPSFANSNVWLRLSKAADKSIIITSTFDPLFDLVFQDSIILKRVLRIMILTKASEVFVFFFA